MTQTTDTIERPRVTIPLRLLTHSAESAFHACPRRYQLSYVRGLRPAHDSDPLRLGSAVHAGLEAMKGAGDNVLSYAMEAIDFQYVNATCPPWLTFDEFEVERHAARSLVGGWYMIYAGTDGIDYLAAEQSFNLPIYNPASGRSSRRFRNAGKIDAIGRLPDGRLALIEHKTTSDDLSPDSDYWKRLQLDAQISRYWLAAHSMGHLVETVIYDVIRKPSIRPKAISKADKALATSQGHYCGFTLTEQCPERETPAMFGARLLSDIKERPEFYYARREIPRLDTDLSEFRFDSWATLKAIEACDKAGYYPRNANSCCSPYRCQYIDVCRGLRGDPEERTPDGFRVVENLHPELQAT